MVIESGGVIGAETGILPDKVYETHVIPLLLRSFGTINKISFYLGNKKPESTWYFSGDKYDVFWSHINTTFGMVIITNPIEQNNDLTWVMTTVDLAVQEVEEIIAGLDGDNSAVSKTAEEGKEPDLEAEDDSKKVAKAELPKQTSKGSNGSSRKAAKDDKADQESNEINDNEVHEFWKAATLEEEIIRIDSPDSLSFEQAQKLGFIPEGDS
jgi:hypothetical protein